MLICHKKCVIKCEKSSECRLSAAEEAISENTKEIHPQAMPMNPEIITTAPDNYVVSFYVSFYFNEIRSRNINVAVLLFPSLRASVKIS